MLRIKQNAMNDVMNNCSVYQDRKHIETKKHEKPVPKIYLPVALQNLYFYCYSIHAPFP